MPKKVRHESKIAPAVGQVWAMTPDDPADDVRPAARKRAGMPVTFRNVNNYVAFAQRLYAALSAGREYRREEF